MKLRFTDIKNKKLKIKITPLLARPSILYKNPKSKHSKPTKQNQNNM